MLAVLRARLVVYKMVSCISLLTLAAHRRLLRVLEAHRRVRTVRTGLLLMVTSTPESVGVEVLGLPIPTLRAATVDAPLTRD